MSATAPPLRRLSPRAEEIVAAARAVLEAEGPDALTMRRLAEVLGIRAPSIYKHLPSKQAAEAALIEQGLAEMGTALHDAIERPGPAGPVVSLLGAYRAHAVAHPNLYRLATSGPLVRELLSPGIEDWAGEPFFLVCGDEHRAQALWAFAHGMVVLEIDGRFPPDCDIDPTWAAGAATFSR